MATQIQDGKTYAFVNWATQKTIDLFGSQSAAGTKVILYQGHLDVGKNQFWTVKSAGNGYFTLVSAASTNLVVDITGNGGSGTPLIGWTPNGGPNQSWRFTNAGGPQETPSFFIESKNNGLFITNPNGGDNDATQLIAADGSSQGAWRRWVAVPIN